MRAGGSHRWACSLLGVCDDRVHRWRRRLRDAGCVEDRKPGGVALHALRPSEIAEILAVVEQWGPVDCSCRKLAHRGSYEGRVMGVCVDAAARLGCSGADSARTAGSGPGASGAVA